MTHRYSQNDIDAVYRVIAERRDMRHFLPRPVDPDLLQRLYQAAHLAPSVGFMQPWRFIRIAERERRDAIHALVEEERIRTAQALHEREDEFMRLKVEGIRDCGEVLVAALMDGRERHVFGRRTLPEMDLASVACAIQNMWLAARAEGIGMGWVSLFDADKLASLLAMPEGAKPVAVICIGHVEQFYARPMLEQEGWANRQSLDDLVYCNTWGGKEKTIMKQRTLVFGGARSGKSAQAEKLAAAGGKPVIYIATARAGDEEMAARIAAHRDQRGAQYASWRTVEEPLALGEAMERNSAAGNLVLVDCLTVWLTNLLLAERADYPEVGRIEAPARFVQERAHFLQALAQAKGEIVLVSNEVGMGIVPQGAISRWFVDEAGRLNQAVAAICERVQFVAAGLPLELKGRNAWS